MIENRAVEEYLKANGINPIDVANKYLIKDAGDGYKLVRWDIEIAEPAEAELIAIEVAEVAKEESLSYINKRLSEYPPSNELIVSLWEKLMSGNSVEADKLEAKRQAIKIKYPK